MKREERPLAGLWRTRLGRLSGVLCVVALLAPLWPARVAANDGEAGITLRKMVDSTTLIPVLALGLTVDKPQAIPGDTLTYAVSLTNQGTDLGLRGKFTARSHGDAESTVVYYWDELQGCSKSPEQDHEATVAHGGLRAGSNTEPNGADECDNEDGNPHWKALAGFVASQANYQPLQPPAFSTGMTLTATSLASPGVTYPATGDPILGTRIGPKAIGAWQYQATVHLSPTQIAMLADPHQVHRLRNVIHFEAVSAKAHGDGQIKGGDDERNSRASTSAVGLANPLQSQANAGAATNVVVTITLPSGQTVQFSGSTTPALASLAPGASVTLTTTYRVPVVAARGSGELEAAYLQRLANLEGSALRASAAVIASGPSGPVSSTAAPVTTTEHLPIVTIAKTGPATVAAGTTATYPLALTNAGGATASVLAVTDAVPSGATGTVSGIPTTLAAGASSTATQATFAVPASQTSGDLTDTATVTWHDANANGYGPLSSSFTTVVRNTLQGAKLTLALSAGSAGLEPVNGTQGLQITLVNSGGAPIPNQSVTVNVTGANPTALTTVTDSNGQASVSYSGTTPGVDQLQASAMSASITIQSNTVSVTWIAPVEPLSTTPVQGAFYPESSSAQTFVAKPGDTAAFLQTFPTINFNPPANTVPHNVSGVGPTTRPFTDVTTDVVGNFAGTIVAQGGGVQAGLGTLRTAFDAILTANLVVSQPQDITFKIIADDGFILGVGGGASRVSGTLQNPPASRLTAFNGYGVVGAFNQAGGAAPASYQVTVHFPSAGAYPYELDYFECCGSQLSLTMTVVSVNAGSYNLSTGYADTVRPAGASSFPFPWNGAANTTFVGSGSPYDTGALRFDNNTNQPITLNQVTVDIGTHHYDPWNPNLAIPANGTLILANPTGSAFDTSDAFGTATSTGSGSGSGGFIATPFATGFNTMGTLGPVGVAFDNAGNLFVMNYATGVLYKFGPSGGVAGPSTQVSANGIFGCPTSISASSGLAFSKDGKHLYLAQQCSGQVLEVDQTTGVVIRTVASGIPYATGIATDPVSGDLFVTEPSFGHDDIIRVSNPTSANPTVGPYAHPGSKSDGIAFGPDGTLYASICCSAVIIIAGTSASAPGTVLAVISNAALAGNDGIALLPPPPGAVGESIVVNSNFGFLVEIDNPLTATPTFHNIVSGGSRGDFVTVGPDHWLYATQSDNVEKVTSADGTCPFAPSICLTNATVPQVHVVINGFTLDYNDSGLALTGGGIDGECTGTNESQAWQQIGGTGGAVNIPLPPAMTLALQAAPSTGHIVGQSQAFTVAAMDAGGHAVPNMAVQLSVFGANTQQLSGTTVANGTATFSYTGSNAGTDTVTATAFISGQRTVSNAVSIQWTIPAPGGPTGGTSGLAPPSVVITAPADGSVVSQPVAITATIRAPPSSPINFWSVLSQNVSGGSFMTLASGTTIPPATLATFDPTGLVAGTYAITVNATTAAGGGASAVVRVIVGNGGGTTAQTPPTISAPSPSEGSIITKPVPVSATFTPLPGQTVLSWSVSYQSQSQGTAVTLASGAGSPPATLAIFDPTLLVNDMYGITIMATGSGGGTQALTTMVAVSGGLKLGRYVTTFQDLSVPVNGFPMEVRRTYDSADKRVGDFGIGWHVELANFRVSTNRQLGAGGWTEYPTRCIFGFCDYAFTTSTPHYVTVTFPDQHQEVFDFTPLGGSGPLYFQGIAAFTARPGTHSKLEALETSVSNQFNGNLFGISGIYDPTRFRLTTRTGQVLILDTISGLVSMTDRNGNSLTVDAAGVHASSGASLTFTRDSQGRITQVMGPSGQVVSYTYSAAGNLATSTDPDGNATAYGYDGSGRLSSVTGATGALLQTLEYDAAGRVVAFTDANGHRSPITNDVPGRKQTVTDPMGLATTIDTFDDLGDLVRSDVVPTTGSTLTTTYTYDVEGRPTSRTEPGGATSRASYDADGNPVQGIDALGRVLTYAYNANGDLLSVTAPDGATPNRYTYDPAGNLLAVTRSDGSSVRMSYDAQGHPLTITDSLGNVTRYVYDAGGHAVQVTDPAGAVSHFNVDASGRVTSATDPLGATINFSYDAAGQLTAIANAAGNQVSFTYDGLGHQVSTSDLSGRASTFTYDAGGRILSSVDRSSVTTTYTYDADSRLVRQAAGLQVTTYAYDALGRPVGVQNESASVTLTYDAAGRVAAETTSAAGGSGIPTTGMTYTYDAVGGRLSATGPAGTTAYAYDSLERLTGVTDPAGGTFGIAYDSLGRPVGLARPNGVSDSMTYDAGGHLAGIQSRGAAGIVTASSYTVDQGGRRASVTDGAGGVTRYTHDAFGSLISVATSAGTVAYTYDARGNRLSRGASAYAYDAGDRMTSDGASSYTYDAGGRMLTKTDAAGGVTRYSWNGRGQLSGITLPGGSVVFYLYDPFGRRVAVNSAGVVRRYAYDGPNLTAEYDGANNLVAGYTGLPTIDQQLEMTRGGQRYFYLRDGSNNVVALTDLAGSTAATYSYDAFGVLGVTTGSVSNPLTYTGREYDAASGLYYYRARYYDPNSGRFLSEDPVRHLNPYPYAANDPVDFNDPSGALLIEYFALVADQFHRATAIGTFAACLGNLLLTGLKDFRGLSSQTICRSLATSLRDLAIGLLDNPFIDAAFGPHDPLHEAVAAGNLYGTVGGAANELFQISGVDYQIFWDINGFVATRGGVRAIPGGPRILVVSNEQVYWKPFPGAGLVGTIVGTGLGAGVDAADYLKVLLDPNHTICQ